MPWVDSLHVVDHQVVGLATSQGCGEVFLVLPGHRGIGGIQNGDLFVHDDIGVVCYAIGNGEHIFKQVQTPVAGAHPEDLVCNIANVLHDIVTFHSNFCLYPYVSQIETIPI